MSDKAVDSDPSSAASYALDPRDRKRYERRAFLFLTVFLAPAVTVAVVGGYGFIVWMSHIIFGPPAS